MCRFTVFTVEFDCEQSGLGWDVSRREQTDARFFCKKEVSEFKYQLEFKVKTWLGLPFGATFQEIEREEYGTASMFALLSDRRRNFHYASQILLSNIWLLWL